MARSRRSPTPSRQNSSGAGSSTTGNKRGGGGGKNKNKPPPNHPTENDPLHRQNLVRNLRRNDVEMAAIQKVNRTLRQLRDEIVARYGEHTMLDIGEGKIRLKTGEYGTVVNPTVVRVVEGVLYDPKSPAAAAAGSGSGGGSPEKKGTDPGSPSQSPSKTKSPGNDDSSLASPAKSSTTKSSEKSPAKAAAAAAAVATPISTIPPDEVPLEDDEEEEQQQEEEEDASSSSSQPNTSRSTRSTKKTDVIRAYLLRYQLRRRLLNRLFRRLNRVSRAMDGASPLTSGLTGPNPPKYGDVHLDVDEDKYAEFTNRYGPMMEARRRVQDARDRARIDDVMSSSMSMSMSVTSEITDMGQEDDDADDGDDDGNAPADSAAVAAGAIAATNAAAATAYDGSSGQSLATICNDVDGVDEADLALLMETEAGYDKVVTYHDMTKAGGGRRGSPTGSGGGGGSSSAKKSPSKRSGGFGEGSPIKVESSSAADEVAPASTSTTSGAGSDAAAAAAADDDDDDDAVPPTTPSGKINGIANNGNGDDSDSSAATAAATNTAAAASTNGNGNATNGDVSSPPAIVQLVPGKIRKTVTFPLAYDDPPDETQDFAVMKYGTGIGAAHRTMNSREREMEYKRWKTDIVSKIPVQPTFAELGLENRVFNLEGRRKRAAAGGGGATDGAAAENDGVEEKEEDMMDVDSKEGEEEEKEGEGGDVDTMEVDGEDEKKEGDGDVDGKEAGNDDDHKKKEDGDEAKNPKIFKQKKLISLAAAPSFYSQDLRRIRILHHDLMIRSGFERCKKKVEEAKAAYDRAYKVSTDLHTKKNVAAASLNKFVYMKRGLSEKIRTEHTLLVAVKRNQWQKAHEEWVGRRMAAGLPVPPAPAVQQSSSHTPDAAATNATATAQNGTVHGTPTIAAKLSDSASTEEAKEAASTLGSVVDAVAIRAEVEGGGMTNGHDGVGVAIGSVPTDAVNFPPFVEPPPKPIPESMEGDRQEALLRKSVTDISAKLTVAEEERKRAWRKMLKTKEEYPQYGGGPPRGGGGGGGTRRKPAARATYRAPAAPAPAARAVYRAPAAAPAPAARTAYRAPAASAPAAPSYGLTGAYGQTSVYATGGHALPAAYGGTNYGYGAPAGYIAQHQIPMQQQQQRMRPGVPTAPTGTMAMVAANAATLAAASANAQATVPRTYNAHQQQQTAQALAAYQAQRQQGTTTSAVPDAEGSQSKYSTASVQARTFNDGSVAPTVPPKRGEDGLFLRPTGRARKNMDWDAINGLWVPESGPD